MSTVINTAYRIPLDKLEDFKAIVTEYQMDLVINHLDELINKVGDYEFYSWVEESPKCVHSVEDLQSEDVNPVKEFYYRYLHMMDQFVIPAAEKSTRDTRYDLECGWNFYTDGEYFYMTPWGEYWTYKDIDKVMADWVKDFCYWNDTDSTPDGIEYDSYEWQGRKKKWNELLSGPYWRNPFKLFIVRLDGPFNSTSHKLERGIIIKNFGEDYREKYITK